MIRFRTSEKPASVQFWLLVAFLSAVFLLGGSARGDVRSLILLRPLAVLVLAYALTTLTRVEIRRFLPLFLLAGAAMLIPILHLISLPPSVWHALPGRGIIADIDHAAGLGEVWRPLSMAPRETWNALWSIVVPLAVLVVAVQLTPRELRRLAPIIIGYGLLSALLGLAQIAGPIDGPLYLYEVTNGGSPVGLLANRNHASVFLGAIFPLLALWAGYMPSTPSQARRVGWFALAIGAFLVPMILVTGSRSGLITGILSLASVPFLYRASNFGSRPKSRRPALILALALVGIVALGALFAWFSQDRAINRLLTSDTGGDRRFEIWNPILNASRQYFPFGSGAGSYVEAFQVNEPAAILGLNYSNHAHNDYLEVFMTMGIPGMILLAVAVCFVLWRSAVAWRMPRRSTTAGFARGGSVILLLFALASASDYPLRTPALICVAVIAAVWLCSDSRQDKSDA